MIEKEFGMLLSCSLLQMENLESGAAASTAAAAWLGCVISIYAYHLRHSQRLPSNGGRFLKLGQNKKSAFNINLCNTLRPSFQMLIRLSSIFFYLTSPFKKSRTTELRYFFKFHLF